MIGLGASIREEPVLSDALAVVREVVDRSHRNLRAIHDRLSWEMETASVAHYASAAGACLAAMAW